VGRSPQQSKHHIGEPAADQSASPFTLGIAIASRIIESGRAVDPLLRVGGCSHGPDGSPWIPAFGFCAKITLGIDKIKIQ